ncbi:MAG: glycoside hydrolase family 57 protein [Alloprevotella sp.]|nr:glycoside hydrolase family 57 protein [Alloprevotella sp.]
MKTVCLYFEIHQNIHLKRYRFFDIGTDHYYYDDYENERSITETAEKSYVPALEALIDMAKKHPGYFKCAISLSGTAIELLESYAPQVLELLGELNDTGCVEFLAEPYSHGFSSLKNPDYFREEVSRLCKKVKALFGQTPKVFRNSCLVYDDEIGETVASMGFKGMLAEGAKHVLGWKSPHFVYNCCRNPKLKLLLRDHALSEDISFRFNDSSWSEYPLFADTYASWISELPEEDQVINIFMELCALGIFQPLSSNILEFMKALPKQLKQRGITFSTPSEICAKVKSSGDLVVEYPTSWVDEECDMSPWLGNQMQREACEKLYSITERVRAIRDRRLQQDFDYLQASNNLRFMSTKPSSYGGYRGIYDSPYDAFTNYMNILGDFTARVNNLYPDMDNEEINALTTTIANMERELELKDKELQKLRATLARQNGTALQPEAEPAKPKAAPKKAKPATKKATTAAKPKKAATAKAKKPQGKAKAATAKA